MSNTSTTIEWTNKSWSPVTGCTKVSPGCRNCYAEAFARRFPCRFYPDGQHVPWTVKAQREAGKPAVMLHPERLSAPLKWRKPSLVFVNSMSDLFHEDIHVYFIVQVFGTMAKASAHTFQVLTKRPERMRDLLNDPVFIKEVAHLSPESVHDWRMTWPLPNVWLGVSVENQRYADERIPLLLQTPAAVRFISAEPLLGPVDVSRYVPRDRFYMMRCEHCGWIGSTERTTLARYGDDADVMCGGCQRITAANEASGLDWVICGGESGPKARPMHPSWVRSIRDQCGAAGVPLFIKQMGSVLAWEGGFKDRKGGDMSEWREEFRIRQMPEVR